MKFGNRFVFEINFMDSIFNESLVATTSTVKNIQFLLLSSFNIIFIH